jgi:hypothetical protein
MVKEQGLPDFPQLLIELAQALLVRLTRRQLPVDPLPAQLVNTSSGGLIVQDERGHLAPWAEVLRQCQVGIVESPALGATRVQDLE